MTDGSFSTGRMKKLLLILAASVVLPALCGVLRGARLDHLIVWCFLCVILFLCIALYMEHERLNGLLEMGLGNSYSMHVFLYLIGLAAASVFALLPAYTAPVMAVSVLCCGTFRTRFGMVLGIFFALLTALCGEGGELLAVAYVLLALLGALFVELYEKKELRLWTTILIVSVSVVIPACCQYPAVHTLKPLTVLVTAAGSALTVLALRLAPMLRIRVAEAEEISLNTIMDEYYHLRKEILRYSTIDYDHAVRTSNIAARVAQELGADVKLARAAAFYYRVGRLEGEPFVENGVRLAQQNCFPDRLVDILAEYNGINRLPSTLESAIVQIADMIVTKFDLLDKDTFSAGWNRDIVIYQSMNEKSTEGLYDRCGLSMNQFLKIRELLVKEEMLV